MHQDLLTSTTSFDLESASDGCDSPRTKIARKFGSLELDEGDGIHREWTHSPRKRTRLNSEELAGDSSSPTSDGQTLTARGGLGLRFNERNIQKLTSSGPLDTGRHRQSRLTHYLQHAKPKRFRSPPPGMLKQQHSSSDSSEVSSGSGPGETWQESEITGMAIDFAAGDDGEGINGIAFRPTPQAAYARKQKRRQQVSEWKVREAREARVRRLERRNGCRLETGHDGDGDDDRERSVRFVDPGL